MWTGSYCYTIFGTDAKVHPIYADVLCRGYHFKVTFQDRICLAQLSWPRIFSDVGCRLGDWLNRYRVNSAKELLVSTDKKNYKIAEEVGFSGYKYFSVCFLKYTGCSARDYRYKYKKPLSRESGAES